MKKLVVWRCKADFYDIKDDRNFCFISEEQRSRAAIKYLRFQKGEIRILNEFEEPEAIAYWEQIVL